MFSFHISETCIGVRSNTVTKSIHSTYFAAFRQIRLGWMWSSHILFLALPWVSGWPVSLERDSRHPACSDWSFSLLPLHCCYWRTVFICLHNKRTHRYMLMPFPVSGWRSSVSSVGCGHGSQGRPCTLLIPILILFLLLCKVPEAHTRGWWLCWCSVQGIWMVFTWVIALVLWVLHVMVALEIALW